MNGIWRMIFPEQGIWFEVNRKERIGAVMSRINTTYPITYYQFEGSYCIGNQMGKIPPINSVQALTIFHRFLVNNCGKLLIRLQVKEKENVYSTTPHTS